MIFCLLYLPMLFGYFFKDSLMGNILLSLSMIAAVVFLIILWFYYNLPGKLNMLQKDIAK